jgi:hypothetical protein
VLLGHLQRENIDYFETYAPVVDFTAVRIALVLASFKNMSIHLLDVKCAFLNGELKDETYMRLPDSYAPNDGSVCMLKRSIYGLRQAPRAWHTKLTADLATLGYTSFQDAESIFWRDKDNIKVFLLIYVDDILLLVSPHDAVKYVKEEIASLYTIKDLGEANYFLGIKLDRNSNGTLRLSKTNYIENILERFNMTASKTVSSPMVPNQNMMGHKPIKTFDLEACPSRMEAHFHLERALYIPSFDHKLTACTSKETLNTTAVNSCFLNKTTLSFCFGQNTTAVTSYFLNKTCAVVLDIIHISH